VIWAHVKRILKVKQSQEEEEEVIQIHGNLGLIVLNHVGMEYKVEQDHFVPRKRLVKRKNHLNHATLSHVQNMVRRKLLGDEVEETDLEEVEEAEEEGLKEGCQKDVEVENIKT